MNYIKVNIDKCHLFISGNKSEYMLEKLDQDLVWESNNVELLEVTIDNNLRFDKQCIKYSFKSKDKAKCFTRVRSVSPFL